MASATAAPVGVSDCCSPDAKSAAHRTSVMFSLFISALPARSGRLRIPLPRLPSPRRRGVPPGGGGESQGDSLGESRSPLRIRQRIISFTTDSVADPVPHHVYPY